MMPLQRRLGHVHLYLFRFRYFVVILFSHGFDGGLSNASILYMKHFDHHFRMSISISDLFYSLWLDIEFQIPNSIFFFFLSCFFDLAYTVSRLGGRLEQEVEVEFWIYIGLRGMHLFCFFVIAWLFYKQLVGMGFRLLCSSKCLGA